LGHTGYSDWPLDRRPFYPGQPGGCRQRCRRTRASHARNPASHPHSDSGILLGKLMKSIGVAWFVTQIQMVVALVMVNVVYSNGAILFYSPVLCTTGLVLSLMMALLAANIGTTVSLFASTAREAQQTMTISMFALFVLPTFVCSLLPLSASVSRATISKSVPSRGLIALIIGVGLLTLNAVLVT
jgi:hypothetical protein